MQLMEQQKKNNKQQCSTTETKRIFLSERDRPTNKQKRNTFPKRDEAQKVATMGGEKNCHVIECGGAVARTSCVSAVQI